MTSSLRPPRLLVIPGLHDSGPDHWQTWLQGQYRDAQRVVQQDWADPDLERWAARISATIESQPAAEWIAAAHSFGCLALIHHLAQEPASPIRAALLVAPADPDKFKLGSVLSTDRLDVPATMVCSETDPWMRADTAQRWAECWGARVINFGDAGHVNAESGFGSLPLARRWIQAQSARWAREQRPRHADPNFVVSL